MFSDITPIAWQLISKNTAWALCNNWGFVLLQDHSVRNKGIYI